MENISEAGTWIRAERFQHGDKFTEREAGEKVGSRMAQWRKTRTEHPELFAGIRVWQTPTAFQDGVAWAWQQEEESSRFESQVRIVDALATCWSPESQERNFLSQCVQAAVAPGCTPLCQVTDTGFAQPAKAAGREEHERQRRLLLYKARQENASPVFKVGPRELLQTARAMHDRMVQLNQERKTVLAESRACGWLHWRPDCKDKVLKKADEESWGKKLTEGSSRMGPAFRAGRDSFVHNGLPAKELTRSELVGEPRELQVSYFEQCAEDLELQGQQDVISPQEQLELEAALLHPSLRTALEEEMAQVALVTSQKPAVRKSTTTPTKLSRGEKGELWRDKLRYSTVQDRLDKLVPSTGKKSKSKNRAEKKAAKKKVAGKPWCKLSAQRKAVKNHLKALKASSKKQAAIKAKPQEVHVLTGQLVKVIAPAALSLWRNSQGIVQKVDGSTATVLLKGTEKFCTDFPVSQLYLVSSKEKMPMAFKLDLRKVLLLQKQAALSEAGGQVQFSNNLAMLEGPELSAFWHSVRIRGCQDGDSFNIGQTVYIEPHAGKVAVQAHLQEAWSEEATDLYKDLEARLKLASTGEEKCLVLCPIQSEGPRHWTLLTAQREQGEKFEVSYFDSLSQPSISAQGEARRLFTLLYNLLGVSKFAETELPVPDTAVNQADGWSCGYHVCHRMEEQYRRFRGEGMTRIYNKPDETRQELNKWVKVLLDQKIREGGAAKAGGTSSSSSTPLPPPPLPPPALPPTVAGPAKAGQPTGVYGCPRCRHRESGCLSCNPEKMLRHAEKK